MDTQPNRPTQTTTVPAWLHVLDTDGESTSGAAGDEPAGADVLRLCVLRLLAAHGETSGLELARELRDVAPLLGIPDPEGTYPLLHSLQQEGLVAGSADRPPQYRLTASGSSEAGRLSHRVWPAATRRLRDLCALLAPSSIDAPADGPSSRGPGSRHASRRTRRPEPGRLPVRTVVRAWGVAGYVAR